MVQPRSNRHGHHYNDHPHKRGHGSNNRLCPTSLSFFKTGSIVSHQNGNPLFGVWFSSRSHRRLSG